MNKIVLYALFVLVLLLVACSSDKQQAQDNKQRENEVDEKAKQPESADKSNTFPLTGIKTDKAVDNRIVGVMVNNHTKARPQTGLSKADIVFEILAEGQITRFLALFQSEKPAVVGPVRSAREYYFELADGYGALYVYHGAAGFINNMIKDRGIEHLNGSLYDNDGHLFKRESFRNAPHNSYLQFNAVYNVAKQKGYEVKQDSNALPFLQADEAKAVAGEPAKQAEIVYSNNPMEIVEYKYDPKKEQYTRYNDRKQTVERNSDESILLDNIFIVETQHQVIDDAGRRKIDITSGGDGYLLQKGKLQKVKWKNDNGRIIPVKNGQPVGFAPGKTWINIVPANPGIAQSVNISN